MRVRNLLNQFAGLFIDDADDGDLRGAVNSKGEFVFFAEELRGVDGLYGLNQRLLILGRLFRFGGLCNFCCSARAGV